MLSTLFSAGTRSENFVDITVPWWGWYMLLGVIGALLLIDILIVHRRPHVAHLKEAAIESIVWVSIGVGFTFVIWAIISQNIG